MDAADDLRAALERRDAQYKAEERKREELARLRREFERDEASVRQQLHEAVDIAVRAFVNSLNSLKEVPPPAWTGTTILFEPQRLALTWEIHWGGHDHLLYPDGTLKAPGSRRTTYTLSTVLHNSVDSRLKDVRRGCRAHSDHRIDFFAEAFGNDPMKGDEQKIRELQERLSVAKHSFMEELADLLRQLDISTV